VRGPVRSACGKPSPLAGRVRVAFLAGVVLTLTLLAAPAFAVQPDEILSDPALEQRARALSAELRCMVCQNQSIDDSDAPLARDLRLLVRERLLAGDSDDEVTAFLVDRYGEFVLLRPSFSGHTLLLWLAAPAVLIAGGLIAWGVVGRNRRRAEAAPLSAEEEAELARLRGGAAD
jgi:cytochrome c-type biogenesis protein CcmH